MMINEFEARTGIYPTTDLYRIIEEYYYEFDGDKDEFCEAYKNNTDGLAEEITHKANIDAALFSKKQKAAIDSLKIEVEKLAKQLEKEQEWTAYEIPENVRQDCYTDLRDESSTRTLTDEEAKAYIADDYGFDPDRITILHSVPIYERNRHAVLRKIGEHERLPLYNATDWNYIRFDCGRMSYELDNGELRFFSH